MNHYTYIIQHKTEDKRYIGVRSCKSLPIEDTTYWGSSNHLPDNIKKTHVKIIIKQFETRQEAVEHEILLHKLNNVAVDECYYNKACQTSTGFDTAGTKQKPLSDEHKAKIGKANSKPKKDSSNMGKYERTAEILETYSQAQKDLYKQGYTNPRTGITMSDELKAKISNRKKELGCGLGAKNPKFKPWFIINPEGIKKIFTDITKEEKSLQDGFPKAHYQRIYTRSKGKRPMKSGKSKGYIVGNVDEDIV